MECVKASAVFNMCINAHVAIYFRRKAQVPEEYQAIAEHLPLAIEPCD